MDLAIRRFHSSLVEKINESQLPMEVKHLVLKDIVTQLKQETDKCINAELKQEMMAQEQLKQEEGGEDKGV